MRISCQPAANGHKPQKSATSLPTAEISNPPSKSNFADTARDGSSVRTRTSTLHRQSAAIINLGPCRTDVS